jgi:hypothetical protein
MTHTVVPRKTIILATILAVLVVIFVVQERGGSRRNTVAIPDISGEIDQIRIVSGDEELRFSRRDAAAGEAAPDAGSDTAAWTMGEEGYPVNPDTLATIEDQILTLREVDVVTSRGNPADYGLTEESSRTLRIFTGDLEPVALQLGDTAAAGNAVYGRVNGGDAIVLLPQALDTAVAVDPLRYREKTMAAVPEDEIVEVRITSPNFEVVRVVRKISGDDTADAPGNGAAIEGTDAPSGSAEADSAPDANWQLDAPVPDLAEQPGASQFNALIREVAALEATGFPEYDESGAGSDDPDRSTTAEGTFPGAPLATVVVERTGGSPVTIDLWPPVDERVPAAASTTPYRFYLPEWRARRLLLGLERYL